MEAAADEGGGVRVVAPGAFVEDADDLGYRPAPEDVRRLAERGRTVLVRCTPQRGSGAGAAPEDGAAAEEVALASVYAWLGARVFATGRPDAVRQALDLVASVQGRRPPAVARRGLA
ncbi:hypothetical protein [Streptomonospora wellingtoniae]|uniref:Uncharacterized protein n=1 Tax=Streptomonospora wellingtoniae TaxID=3075544 RepID=A0ABU2KSQ9_9ACTN|nr:hypothetical protein [Streptomonospora sp. DSM 45055]MDT0302319.1 hypothetical protein [Streptomonospora sp. DSM 45055]